MRLTALILSSLTALFHFWVLRLNIEHLDFVACVFLPETSIQYELWHKIIVPSVMLTLATVLLVLIAFRNLSGKIALGLSLLNLASVPIYYATVTGLAVSDPAASRCQTSRL